MHWIRRWVGLQGGLGTIEKSLFPLPRMEPRLLGRPARGLVTTPTYVSHDLYFPLIATTAKVSWHHYDYGPRHRHHGMITGKATEKKRYPETPAIFKNQTTVSFLTKVLVSANCNGMLYTEPGMPFPNPSADQLFIPPIR